MISTTVNSIPVFLVTQSPDWEAGVQGDFIKQTIRDESVSNREEREPTAEKLRATLKYKSVLSATDAATLRTILAAWDNRPVLCPFWPAESLIADAGTASVQGALRVWYEPDWSAWDIGTGAGPGFTPSADCLTAPILWGRFDSFPDQRVATGGDDEIVTFSLLENGSADYALEPPAVTLTNGDSVNGQTVPLMTPTFAWGTNSEQIEVRIKRAKIGYGREDADTYYTQEPRTKHTLLFDWLEDSTAPAYLLALFADRGGSIAPWWAIAAHSTTARVFGRFYTDRLSIMWERPNRCGGEWGSCKVEFLTLPNEETVPAGETFGETLGPKPAKVFLYLTTDGTITDRSTSYESALAGPGGTYTPRTITHGKIIEEINLQKNDCTLTVDHWTGGPFARLLQHPNSAPLTVTIYEAYLDALEDAAPIYTGTCQAPKINQSQMKINLRGPGAILSTEGPRMLLQQDCNATFCDVRCGLDIADFTETADLLSFTDGVAKMDAAFSDHPESYFQNGFVERSIGGVPQRYLIADSYDFGDGKLALVLIGTVLPAITGPEDDWSFAPGCDGKFSTCRDRFSNAVNFRGAPYLPNDNPSMLVLPQTQQGSKK